MMGMSALDTNNLATQSGARTKGTSKFVLTRQNQKGQVAIFVALIFQVIFVFFAMLINIGLLVHHKINLQQSTDIAAYYGAMKQAEIMNAIAHINFQVRQSWKLLTWRYRILGTFGFYKASADGITIPGRQKFPFEYKEGDKFYYNGSDIDPPMGLPTDKCMFGAESLGVQDIPFFCIGHSGFASWSQTESNCRLNCEGFTKAAQIPKIQIRPPSGAPQLASYASNLAQTLTGINNNMQLKCQSLGPIGASLITRYLIGYITDTNPKLRTIEALARDLSTEAESFLDIEGKSIKDASRKTFENNLTEANHSGIVNFEAINGLANNSCSFKDGVTDGSAFLKKIEFQFINYFLQYCAGADTEINYKPENLFQDNGDVSPTFNSITPNERAVLVSLFDEGRRHTVGYEKNPHCVEYYGVKATTEPQIPFLPLAKIKLSAFSIAKPFGGTIGPWYGKTWPQGSPNSVYTDSIPDTKMDPNLPRRMVTGVNANDIMQSVILQPNYSLFVDDDKGLRRSGVIAAYHSALAKRDIKNYGSKVYDNKNPLSQFKNQLPNGAKGPWPDYTNWDHLIVPGNDLRLYDSLATTESSKAGMRALEIAAVAPNQFEVHHYSIDPDFYNNYYVKLYKSIGTIAALSTVGMSNIITDKDIRADLGAVGMDGSPGGSPLNEKTFSVKDQILVKNQIFKEAPETPGPGNKGKKYSEILNHIVSYQSSLLTSWTFINFKDYDKFPGDPIKVDDNNMAFGQCLNDWNDSTKDLNSQADASGNNFRTPMDTDSKLPPVPGNCVTGGRTGYSVKIISPAMVREGSGIINELKGSFFNF